MRSSFDYTVLRVVPHTEREEFFNAGVVLHCAEQRFLGVRVHVDTAKLHALAPTLPMEEVASRLHAIVRICAGEKEGGPIAELSLSARFHWIAAPRSTLIQPSPVHSGLCDDPEQALERIFGEVVLA